MITSYTKVVNLPIVALKTQTIAGKATDLIIKKSEFALHGFLVKPVGIHLQNRSRVLSHSDIINISNEAILIADGSVIVDLNESLRLEEAISQGYYGIHQRVVTKNGKRIGKLFDYLISLPDLTIPKIYIHDLFSERVIPTSLITNFDGKTITIKDDFELAALNKALAAYIP